LRQFLVIALVSLILVLSSVFTGQHGNATVSASAAAMALQQTCSCGVDCATTTCTFNCQVAFMLVVSVSLVVVPPRPKLKGVLLLSTEPYQSALVLPYFNHASPIAISTVTGTLRMNSRAAATISLSRMDAHSSA
jgi:hypothetical protein